MHPLADHSVPPKKATLYQLILLYGCCAIVALLFVHFYTLYSLLLNIFGDGFIAQAPFILPLFVLAYLVFLTSRKNNRRDLLKRWPWLIAGTVIIITGLFLPNPEFGVKRVHVTEYLLLSLLVRYTLSHRISGLSLLFFGTLFTAVLGIHDEFLQGLHPSRTYGIRDMAVNTAGALGGNFLYHGLNLFPGVPNSQSRKKRTSLSTLQVVYLIWLISSVLLMIIPIYSLQYSLVPPYLLLPLGASLVFWSCFFTGYHNNSSHGITAISLASFLLLVYPVIINVFQVPFH